MVKGIGTYLAAALMGLLLGYVLLGLYGAMAEVKEDDITFNCHVMGNMICGEKAPWHGFVNF